MKDSERIKIADTLWQRLVTAFNEEAKTYDPKAYTSLLGSVGPVEQREVSRSHWWKHLGGEKLLERYAENREEDSFYDYWAITHWIEYEHRGEKLATGRIYFGS